MLHARAIWRALAGVVSDAISVLRLRPCAGGSSNISAVKTPVGGSSKSVVLIATDFPVAIVLAFYL